MLKWTALGFAGLTGAAILYLAGVLLVAHSQIREIAPDLPSRQALLDAVDVPDGPVGVHYVNTATQPMETGPSLAHPAFLLEWPSGRRLLVDTGMKPENAVEFGEPLELVGGADPTIPHGSIAAQLGNAAPSVDGVVFTHLHNDHTNGTIALCEERTAPLPVFQTPWQFDERNHTTEIGAQDLVEAGCTTITRLADGPIYEIPSFPGLVAVGAGGHTPGSTLYFARVGERLWIFSGDVTNTREELIENRPKLALYSWLVVPESPERLEALRRWLADWDRDPQHAVVVSHDLDALENSGIPEWSHEPLQVKPGRKPRAAGRGRPSDEGPRDRGGAPGSKTPGR